MQSGLPDDADPQAAINAHKRQQFVKNGMNWVLESVAGEEVGYGDDYASFETAEALDGNAPRFGLTRNYAGLLARRTLVSTVMLGSGFLRPHLANAATRAVGVVRGLVGTPAGRRVLRSGSVWAGGLAGAAAVAAVAAFFLNRKAGPAPVGVLQGSPLSPLLANIYLHPFDQALTESGNHLARFADDWVITAPEQTRAEHSYNEALKALARLRLKVNLQKTRILPPEEKLEWLGVVIP